MTKLHGVFNRVSLGQEGLMNPFIVRFFTVTEIGSYWHCEAGCCLEGLVIATMVNDAEESTLFAIRIMNLHLYDLY
jgi:hypothetical protein